MYSINFNVTNKNFCLSPHYNGANSYLFDNGAEIQKFKAKDSEILVGPICLGNISKDWSVDNMTRTGFTGYVYDFSVDYDIVAVDDTLNVLIFACIKFRDSQIFLKTDFSRVLNFANRHM